MISPDTRAKLSLAMRHRWRTGGFDFLRRTTSDPANTGARPRRPSKLLGRPLSPEHRSKLWVTYPYTDRFGRAWRFASKRELAVARTFDARRLVWEYEPLRLRLSDGRTYRPDFWVDAGGPLGTFVEVKSLHHHYQNLDKAHRAAIDGYPITVVDLG